MANSDLIAQVAEWQDKCAEAAAALGSSYSSLLHHYAVQSMKQRSEITRLTANLAIAQKEAAQAQKERDAAVGTPLTPPQPLTLEELRGMDGKPVYVVCLKSDTLSCWGYVTDGCVVGYHASFGFSEHGKTWLAYPTEPGRDL